MASQLTRVMQEHLILRENFAYADGREAKAVDDYFVGEKY